MGRKQHEDASDWSELAPAPQKGAGGGAAKTENGRTKSGRKNGPEAAAKRREQRRRRRIRQRDAGKVPSHAREHLGLMMPSSSGGGIGSVQLW